MRTHLEAWLGETKNDLDLFASELLRVRLLKAIMVIEKLKGVIHHVSKKEHKPWLKKCLEDALAIDPEKL